MRLILIFILIRVFAFGNDPSVLFISIDTLRADHLSCYGYSKDTSPAIDKLMSQGVMFTQARTVEPLTAPSMASVLTGRFPHQHGLTRNGQGIRSELPSLAQYLRDQGYQTAAIVSNWTLRDSLCKFGSHFDEYREVFTRKRWFGLFKDEANATDVTQSALEWLDERDSFQPFFLWVHYVEPHAPYRFQRKFAGQVGVDPKVNPTKKQRYDTEIAFNDTEVGRLLQGVKQFEQSKNLIIVFFADHGESLGEHAYWGHGRHLYEPTLRIPLGFIWPGRIIPGTQTAPALLTDIAPTIMGLLNWKVPDHFVGWNWSSVLQGKNKAREGRELFFQAHKGAVQNRNPELQTNKSRKGLLEIAMLKNGVKEIFSLKRKEKEIFNLNLDPGEKLNLSNINEPKSHPLEIWMLEINEALKAIDKEPTELRQQDLEVLKSLGYFE